MNSNRAYFKFVLGVALLLPLGVQAAQWEARLDWGAKAVMSALVSGVVAEVSVSAGERVEKGQSLVRLDNRSQQAALKRADAALNYQTKLREEARIELERARELYDRTVLSDHDLQLAEIDYAKAEAAYLAALESQVNARQQLGYSHLRAADSGVVVLLNAAEGASVNAVVDTQPLIVVASDRYVKAVGTVPAEIAASVRIGSRVSASIDGREVDGKVSNIASHSAKGYAPGEYGIEVMLTVEPGSRWTPGQKVIVTTP